MMQLRGLPMLGLGFSSIIQQRTGCSSSTRQYSGLQKFRGDRMKRSQPNGATILKNFLSHKNSSNVTAFNPSGKVMRNSARKQTATRRFRQGREDIKEREEAFTEHYDQQKEYGNRRNHAIKEAAFMMHKNHGKSHATKTAALAAARVSLQQAEGFRSYKRQTRTFSFKKEVDWD